MSPTEPATSASNGDQVAEAVALLYRAIVHGEVTPGATMTQVELSKLLGVGRTPLREALRIGHSDALLEFGDRRIRFADLSAADVEDLYIARITLESLAVRFTLPDLRSADLAELEGLLAQMDHFWAEQEFDEVEVANKRLHGILVKSAQPRTSRVLRHLDTHAERYRRALYTMVPEGIDAARQEHRAIVDAAKARDIEATVSALVAHYARTAHLVIQRLDDSYESAKLEASVQIATGSHPHGGRTGRASGAPPRSRRGVRNASTR